MKKLLLIFTLLGCETFNNLPETSETKDDLIGKNVCVVVVQEGRDITVVACRDFDYRNNRTIGDTYEFDYEPGLYEMFTIDYLDRLKRAFIQEGCIGEER